MQRIGDATDPATKDNNNVIEIQHMENTGMRPIIRMDSYLDDRHINLGWRSWMVVLYVLLRQFGYHGC